jgi:Glycosyl transferase family 2
MDDGPWLWQILITTIPQRHDRLAGLLAVLDTQMRPGVGVLLCRDRKLYGYRQAIQAAMDAATAEYVSAIADDDSVAPDFIPDITAALASRPDYVGFRVRYTEGGARMKPVIHSLSCGGWSDDGPEYRRDLMYQNPVRREHAQRVRFRGLACDTEWADDLRALGVVRTEVFIDREIFYYQRDSRDNIHVRREPLPDELVRPLPSYPWLTAFELDHAD